ncbi:MAG: hypothetical protein AAB771_01485 [Patescibacteria group bacterium]|mgnify:FL=1
MEGDIFHILNRGVEKRKIFLEEKDYLRFINNLSDFNSIEPVFEPYFDRRKYLAMRKPGNKIIDILCWCLMPNHYHILVQEKINGGASIFAKKISSGYTQYFNLKNKRIGVLFQGRSKIILAEKEEHFILLPYYIFANPVKLIEPHWKEVGIKNLKKVYQFLENYKWSSFTEAANLNNHFTLINKKLFVELFDLEEKKLKDIFFEWLDNQ